MRIVFDYNNSQIGNLLAKVLNHAIYPSSSYKRMRLEKERFYPLLLGHLSGQANIAVQLYVVGILRPFILR